MKIFYIDDEYLVTNILYEELKSMIDYHVYNTVENCRDRQI